MFGIDNLCWISTKATLEASKRAEFLIMQTGMTSFGKAYYKNYSGLVPNVCLWDLIACASIHTFFPLTKLFYKHSCITTYVEEFCTACNEA